MLEFKFDVNMPFANVKEAIAAHEKALQHLQQELPKACAREGHQWGKPKRDDTCVDHGEYVEGQSCNGEDRGSPGYYRREPKYLEAYSRICQRCGKKDHRAAITRSPFETT